LVGKDAQSMAERVDGKFMGVFIRVVKLGIACPSATEGILA